MNGTGRRQGKGSAKKKSEKFTMRINDKVMDDFEKHLKKTHGLYESDVNQSVATAITRVEAEPTTVAKPISVTTRGIGFAVAASYDHAVKVAGRAAATRDMSIHEMYRLMLQAVDYKLYLAQEEQALKPSIIECFERIEISSERKDTLKKFHQLPSSVMVVVETVGNIKAGVLEWHCGYPLNPPIRQDGSKAALLLNPRNIRSILDILSGVGNEEFKEAFVQLNPIPGARFDDENRLLNADQVWPPLYSADMFETEFKNYQRWLNSVGSYIPLHSFPTFQWSPMGNKGCLWCMKPVNSNIRSEFSSSNILRVFPPVPHFDVYGSRTEQPPAGVLQRQYERSTYRSPMVSIYALAETSNVAQVIGATSLVGEFCGFIGRHPTLAKFTRQLDVLESLTSIVVAK